MNTSMTRDRVLIDELNHDLSQVEERLDSAAVTNISTDPVMIEALYELPEYVAKAFADAISTGDISKLRAVVEWDTTNYLNDNGGVAEWLS